MAAPGVVDTRGGRNKRGSAHCLTLEEGSCGGASASGRSLRPCAHESSAHVRGPQTKTRQQQTHHDGTTKMYVSVHAREQHRQSDRQTDSQSVSQSDIHTNIHAVVKCVVTRSTTEHMSHAFTCKTCLHHSHVSLSFQCQSSQEVCLRPLIPPSAAASMSSSARPGTGDTRDVYFTKEEGFMFSFSECDVRRGVRSGDRADIVVCRSLLSSVSCFLFFDSWWSRCRLPGAIFLAVFTMVSVVTADKTQEASLGTGRAKELKSSCQWTHSSTKVD